MARSRRPRTVETSGALSSVCAWRCDSPFPTRMPVDLTLFTPLIPWANSGQQPVIGCLGGQLADRGHSNNDGRRPEAAIFQGYPPGANCGLGEARPRCLLEP